MQVDVTYLNPTQVELLITATDLELKPVKNQAVDQLSRDIKVPGFRPGKSPSSMAEKFIDPNKLSQTVLEMAINDLYGKSLITKSLRPVIDPEIELVSYVPYDKLTFKAKVDVIGKIQLGTYKGLAVKQTKLKAKDQQVNEVIDKIRNQLATREDIKTAAKLNDEIVIDFKGVDAKTKQPITNSEGEDYPLILGSNSFIPGFEEQLIGLKKGDKKNFDITFPKDYHVRQLQSAKVTFYVTVKAVKKLKLPKVDDEFAAKVGPFKTVDNLKTNIKQDLQKNIDDENLITFQNELIKEVLKTSTVELPPSLVQEEKARIEAELRKNASYQGLTWGEYLASINSDDKQFDKTCLEEAELRIKTGLVLGDIAVKEKIQLTKEEVNQQISQYKRQYANDKQMLAELDKPNNINDIKNRLFVQKTIDHLVAINQSKN